MEVINIGLSSYSLIASKAQFKLKLKLACGSLSCLRVVMLMTLEQKRD